MNVSGGGDFTTIKEGVMAAAAGDTVLVAAGIDGASAANSVIFANAGGDNLGASGTNILYVDPLFCGAADGDLTLCANSPCLPGAAANPAGQLIGAYSQGCASCASPVAATTWGAIKVLYR